MRELHKVNNRINVPELRVITKEGENLGILKTTDALKAAIERDLDLVIVTEHAKPPVAKILDYNKFLYEERKRASAIKAKSKKSELKELRLSPTIGEGDLTTRIERARSFLKDGNRVKITLKLRGREMAFPQLGYEKIARFTKGVDDLARPEANPKLIGNIISVTYVLK